MHNKELGRQGEEEAVNFLKKKGYKILERNFKNKLGEIDIVAKDNNTLCFVEVKTRSNLRFGIPQEAVTFSKQRKLNKIALSYLKKYNLLNAPARFDIVSVIIYDTAVNTELIKDAFSVGQ